MKKEAAILIAGPTASGKSGLALRLAARLGGVLINADSMQVYRELRVLTARPSAEDEAQAPHWLYGHVPGAEAYSAGRFMREAGEAISRAHQEGRLPILVGGTGLYFKALLEGLSPIPAVPDAVRAHWRGEAQRLGGAGLHAVLAARDPVMAGRLNPTDAQRVTRALEVLDATGRSLAVWQSIPGKPLLQPEETMRLVVEVEREPLNARIERRLDAMWAGGALEEARALGALGLDPELPVMRALGVRPLLQAIGGKISEDEALRLAKDETRQYAKRQRTWLRGNVNAWKTINAQEMETIERDVVAFIRR